MKDTGERPKTTYIDTPTGIFTQAGTWFRTTEESLKEYAGELLQFESIESLISNAELWLRFSINLTLWMIPLILLKFAPVTGILIVLGLFVLLGITAPLYTSHYLSPVARILNYTLLQLIVYAVFLSLVLQAGDYTTPIIGFLLFVLFRWGITTKIFSPILKWMRVNLYKIPYEDKVLRSLIVRKSLKYRTSLAEVNEIEKMIMRKGKGF